MAEFLGPVIAYPVDREELAMKNQNLLVSAAFLISACATTAPHREAGPPLSVQGIQVRIADVGCSVIQGVSPEEYAQPRQGIFKLTLQIRNDSGQVARFSERRVQLVDSSAPAVSPLTPDHAEVISVFPGETRELPIRFTTGEESFTTTNDSPAGFTADHSLDCHHGFNLVLANAIQLGTPTNATLSAISIPVPR